MAIDFSAFPEKEQLRTPLIIVGVGILVLVALYYSVIAPASGDIRELEAEIQSANQALERNRSLVSKADEVEGRYQLEQEELAGIINNKLAPSQNAVAWASNLIQAVAYDYGVTIESLSGGGTKRAKPASRNAPAPLFEFFQANIVLRCGYHEFGRFLAEMERQIPFARLMNAGLRSASRRGSERQLAINIRYAFPRFTDEAFPEEQRPALANGDTSDPLLLDRETQTVK
ncbi:MAG: type II secretion system protein M [Candidatus Pacebacteria bacterium]|nr:type II secretion system protein M [Candidatus Paceibacterota bacterium]